MANAIPVPSPQLAGEGFLLRPLGAGDGEAMSQFVEGLRHDRPGLFGSDRAGIECRAPRDRA